MLKEFYKSLGNNDINKSEKLKMLVDGVIEYLPIGRFNALFCEKEL